MTDQGTTNGDRGEVVVADVPAEVDATSAGVDGWS